MPQHDLDIANGSGAAVRADINGALLALGTTMKGPNPPPAPQAGMLWLEDDNPSSSVWTLRIFDGVDWVTLGTLDTTGNQFSPAAGAVGMVNLLDNASFLVNQRQWPSGSPTPAPNSYTLDRWRVVTSGQAPSWVDSAGVRTLTAPAGGIEQVIEGARIAADTHVLSWVGSAVATVNGSSVANGGTVSLAGGTNVTVRFSNGTVALPQLQRGRVPTPFEWRNLAIEMTICQRYAERIRWGAQFQAFATGEPMGAPIAFGVPKRVTPTISNLVTVINTNTQSVAFSNISSDGAWVQIAAAGAGSCAFVADLFINAEF